MPDEIREDLNNEYPLDVPYGFEDLSTSIESTEKARETLLHTLTEEPVDKSTSVEIGVVRLRMFLNDFGTWGVLFVNKEQKGYTLEPRPTKGKGPIPLGTYRYKRWTSKKLKKTLRLYDVPGFSDILVHVGNRERDTLGCILVGKHLNESNGKGPEALISSRPLTDWLYDNCHQGNIIVSEYEGELR